MTGGSSLSRRWRRTRVTARRSLYRAARRLLWALLRERAAGRRSALRRRAGDLLRGREQGFLLRLLRDTTFSAAVVGSLLGAGGVHAVEDGTLKDPGNESLLDADGNGRVDLSDAIDVLELVFQNGRPPVLGLRCRPIQGCPERCAP